MLRILLINPNLCAIPTPVYISSEVGFLRNKSMSASLSDDSCVCNQFDFPPTFKYHILDKHAPDQYYYFWIIGLICLIITSVSIIPSIIKIHNEASSIRESMDTALLPFSYQICVIILFFPLIGVFFNLLVLIAPITESIFIFMLNLFNALTLYVFARLLIMYLGSYSSAIKIWRDPTTKPTKFWASKPFCCLSFCIEPKQMTKRDFRRIYYLIQQYIFLGPFIIFLSLFFRTAVNDYYQDLNGRIVGIVQVCSSIGCLYASQCLLNASREILKEYEISAKFKMIQFGIITLTVPSALLSLIGVNTAVDDIYTDEVMDQAWSGAISCILYTILSYFYTKYFNVQTARNAMQNAKAGSHLSSLKSNAQDAYQKLDDDEDKEDHEEQLIVNQHNETTKIVGNDDADLYTALQE